MIISVVNHTHGKISDADLHVALRAINRQIACDFAPYWHITAALRLEGGSQAKPSKKQLTDMRGDAIMYLWDGSDADDALGYHEQTELGVPYGFVFTDLAKQLHENWTVMLSHEALELIGDPQVNLLVQGPHPGNRRKVVFHWHEMCDAVQAETYKVDGVEVSNFVLPLYFTGGDENGSRNDFLGTKHGGKLLQSFGINPGGYIGFFNPATGEHQTVSLPEDKEAARRLKVKSAYAQARRGTRYETPKQTSIAAPAAATRGAGAAAATPAPAGVKVLRSKPLEGGPDSVRR
jgi:hypothetical protein